VLKEVIGKIQNTILMYLLVTEQEKHIQTSRPALLMQQKDYLKGFRFHDLRHTWCSRLCELGVDEATIMELGRWKTRSMINRYAHPSTDHKRQVLERLNKIPLIFTTGVKTDALIKLTIMLTSVKI